MKYKNTVKGKFISRKNRFIASVNIDGKEELCHVKNTGRLKELLIPDADVFLEMSDNPKRKTKYDLISVYKNDLIVNIDSQAPNKVFREWAEKSDFFGNIKFIKPECKYKNSRFDFYIETDNDKIFIEVKGVTLEENGVLKFPDAPTERGIKHLNELCDCVENGYKAYVFFIIQTEKADYFTPNKKNHPAFAEALRNAVKSNVAVKCLNCKVTLDSISAKGFVDAVI